MAETDAIVEEGILHVGFRGTLVKKDAAVIENERYAHLVDFKVQVFRLIGYDRIAYFFDHGEALACLKGQGAEARETKRYPFT